MQGLQRVSTQRPRLADLVYDQIVSGLQSGLINPNNRLHQEKLAEELAVSRTPVREALLRLQQEGVLASSTNGGFEIRKFTQQEVRDIYQTRQAIEGFCCGLLAQKADKVILQKLRFVVQKQEALKLNTHEEFYNANRAIHRAFVEATANKFLLENFDALWNRSISIQIFETLDKPKLVASLTGHSELCDAIETKDPTQAQSAMHEHISEGCDLQLTAI